MKTATAIVKEDRDSRKKDVFVHGVAREYNVPRYIISYYVLCEIRNVVPKPRGKKKAFTEHEEDR